MNAITPYTDPAIEDVKRLANLVLALRNEVFVKGQDFGIIQGTEKPTLLLPGMEKLMRAMNLRAEYVPRTIIDDFDKPLFFYRYECRMIEVDTGRILSTAIGSANSMESKWRWRNGDRLCPHCGKAAIIKGKAEYGGGWLCFAKKGGCGAKFKEGDQSIEGQSVGRIENPDIFDQMNTIDKIAQKRSLASAIKGAANVSEFFTVDVEDFTPFEVPVPGGNVVDAVVTEVQPESAPAAPAHAITDAQWREFATRWNQDKQLNYAKLCEILRVQDLRAYPHSLAAAQAAVSVWLINRDREAAQMAKSNEIAAALSSRKPDTRAKQSAPADQTPPPVEDASVDEDVPADSYIGRAIAAETRKVKTGKAIDLTLTNGGKVTIYSREPIRKLSALWADTVKDWDKPGFHPFLDIAGELEVYSEGGEFKFDIPFDFETLHAEPEGLAS